MVERSEVPVFKNEPILVLILGFVTCGIYPIIWKLKMATVFNKIAGKDAISPVIAVLGACCLPVTIYFYYLVSQNLGALGALIGKEKELKDKSTLILILGIFIYPVAMMLVQQYVNEIYGEAKQ
jgi:hypothetical protein